MYRGLAAFGLGMSAGLALILPILGSIWIGQFLAGQRRSLRELFLLIGYWAAVLAVVRFTYRLLAA